jgi:transcriptional regulator with XRE-family HTH domain
MIGDRIRKLRKERGYSQQQLANKLNLTQGAISQWENNQTVPAYDQMASLAKLFCTSIDDLMGRMDIPTPEGDDDKEKYATIGKQILDLTQGYSQAPKTPEARILASGIDKMPPRDRERALNLVKLMFEQYADYFDKGDNDEA